MNRMTSELNLGSHAASSSTVVPLAPVNDVVPTVEYAEVECTVDFIEVANTNIGISTLEDDECKPSMDCIDAVNVSNTDISTVEDDECKPSVGLLMLSTSVLVLLSRGT